MTGDVGTDVGRGPLSGITVVDLGQIYNAPYATLLMALAGAEVVKVEPPAGENLRGRGRKAGAAAPFAMLNSSKRAVMLNLKHPEGVELLVELADRADVFVENYRPGVLARLGVVADDLLERNPRLVYASSSGYGSWGPYRDLPAMDLTVQAMAGVMAATGFPDGEPVKAGAALGDFLGGIHLYGAIVTALYQRERTGQGAKVEVAMLDAVYPSLMSSLGLYFGQGDGHHAVARTGNHHSGMAEAPYNVYPVRDGRVALICVTDAHWRSLTEAMGMPELAKDARYSTRVDRVAHMEDVDDLVRAWSAGLARDDMVARLQASGVPCAPVRELDEVVHDAHLHARGMLRELVDPDLGPLVVPASPLRFDGFEPEVTASPRLGEHNDEVYGTWLGIGPDRLAELREKGVI